ncbi:TPA: hypothetical protein ACKP2V_002487 [Pseudomonas putida]
MEQYILPSVVKRGLHRLVAGSKGFGNLLPSRAVFYLGESTQSKKLFDIANLLSSELKIPLTQNLLEKIADIHSASFYLLNEPQHSCEEYLWGYKATKNVFLRGIFSALAFAELEFCERDLPQNSHEERLTGHLLSKMYSSVTFCADALTTFSKEIYGLEIPINIAYHDLSANGREKVTGSDFGIIVHTNLPGESERVTAVAFQAKKLYKTTAYLPADQAIAQIQHFEHGAYTCLYDVGTEGVQLPPAILKTTDAQDFKKTSHAHAIHRDKLPSSTMALSLFLIQMIQNNVDAYEFSTIMQAGNFMKGTPDSRENFNVSRVMTLSIGAPSYRQEMDDLTKIFPPDNSSEEENRDDNQGRRGFNFL